MLAAAVDDDYSPRGRTRRTVMKTVVSALIALSVLAGIAGSAAAFDAKTFYEQQDRAQH
jgi:hypothetical protein